MSVNKYNSQTGELTALSSGTRTWVGTEAQYQAQKSAGTLPNNCMIVITDDETAMDTIPTEGSPVAVTSDGIYNSLYKVSATTISTSDVTYLRNNVILRKVGNVAQITFRGFKNLVVGNNEAIFYIPSQYRPSSGSGVRQIDAISPGTSEHYRIEINPNGSVDVYCYGPVSGQGNVQFDWTYILG